MDQEANMLHNRYMTGNCTGIIHVVKEGDTLYKIGKMHGVSVSALMYANPYVNIYNLQVGDELCVPVYNMPWNGGTEPQPAGGNMGRPQTMPAGGNMGRPQTMPQDGNMGRPQTMPQDGNMGRPQTMPQDGNMRRTQPQMTAEDAMTEQEIPEVMRMQGSRLEYEIMDDSEL